MNRIVRSLFTAATVALVSGAALAQTPAEKVLARYVAATGGAAAYAKVKSQVTTGTISMPAQGVSGAFTMSYKALNKMVLSSNLPGIGEIGQGYDGKIAWSKDPFSGVRTLEGDELSQVVNELTLTNDPAGWKKVYTKIELLAPGKVGKTKALRVKLTPKKGAVQTLFFDEKTGLLLRRDAVVATQQGNIASESYYADYRNVEGVKLPFKTRIVAGPAEQVMTISSVKNNVAVADTAFAKPKAAPAGKAKQ